MVKTFLDMDNIQNNSYGDRFQNNYNQEPLKRIVSVEIFTHEVITKIRNSASDAEARKIIHSTLNNK